MNLMENCGGFFSRLKAIDRNVAIADDFNRANTGPPPSASWANILGITRLVVVNNACEAQGISTICGAYYSASLADGEIGFTVIDKVTGFTLYARATNSTSTDAVIASFTTGWSCGHVLSGVTTRGEIIPASVLGIPLPGDQIVFRFLSTRLEMFVRRAGAGPWLRAGKFTTTRTVAGGGLILLFAPALSKSRFDDFRYGAMAA